MGCPVALGGPVQGAAGCWGCCTELLNSTLTVRKGGLPCVAQILRTARVPGTTVR